MNLRHSLKCTIKYVETKYNRERDRGANYNRFSVYHLPFQQKLCCTKLSNLDLLKQISMFNENTINDRS